MSIEEHQATFSCTREQKEKIFEVRKYTFLKRKRKEIVDHYRKSHPWTNEEDDQLKELLYSYTSLSWKLISSKLKERSPAQCMYHWNMNLNPGIKKGKWSKEEDELVLSFVKEKGTNWSELQSYLQGRTTKQIRERWVNHLSRDTSNFKWSRELDKRLIELYLLLGSSWVKISGKMPRTSENMVKNRFYSLLRGCVAKYKRTNKEIGNKINQIKAELNKIYKMSIGGGELKLSDFSLESMNDTGEEEAVDKIVSNPYQSKKKNYSLKILIEFLPLLIDDLGIDLTALNNPQIKEDDDLEVNEDKEDCEEDKDKDDAYIDIFNIKDTSIDFFSTSPYEMDIDEEPSLHVSSLLSHQLSSLTTVFNTHDHQLKRIFFDSFRRQALYTLSK